MGNIENVKSEAKIEATGDNIGGIVGINNASISNAVNKGDVSSSNEMSLKVGGIVGENASDSFIYTSCNEGTITNKKHAGGIYGANFGQIENCYFLEGCVKTDNIEETDNSKSKSEYETERNKIEKASETTIPVTSVSNNSDSQDSEDEDEEEE